MAIVRGPFDEIIVRLGNEATYGTIAERFDAAGQQSRLAQSGRHVRRIRRVDVRADDGQSVLLPPPDRFLQVCRIRTISRYCS
jgi:hypothetical protein